MSASSVETAQAGVDWEKRYRVAPAWARGVAALIDFAVLLPIWTLLVLLLRALAPRSIPPFSSSGVDIAVELYLQRDPAFLALVLLFFVAPLAYCTLFWRLSGRTLGQRVMRQKVVDKFGESTSWLRAVLRGVGCVVGVYALFWLFFAMASPHLRIVTPIAALCALSLGALWAAFDAERRALHDWVAGTWVIVDEKS